MRIEFSEESGLHDDQELRNRLLREYQLSLKYIIIEGQNRRAIAHIFSRHRRHADAAAERTDGDICVMAAGTILLSAHEKQKCNLSSTSVHFPPIPNEILQKMQCVLIDEMMESICEKIESLGLRDLSDSAA